MCLAAFASVIPSFVARSTSRRRRVGGSARTSGAPTLSQPAASARPDALTTSSAPEAGRPAAVATLREAGEAAAHRAPASAAHWFAGALRLLADDAPAEERVELLLARAGALATCGHFAEAHSAILESIELVPEDAVALRVRLTTACAGIEHLLGRHADAHGRLARALERPRGRRLARGGRPDDRARLDGVYRMEFEQIRAWAGRALELARPLGDQPLTASAAALLAWGAGLCGSDQRRPRNIAARLQRSSTRSSDGSWRCGSTPPSTWPAPSSTSTASTRRASTQNE